ncbi:hypothetical protein HHL22_17100 [Hymenobacter sp. RP-2-7]|uniref:STAS/SEC14 domain-containing protein n=1 Tax=Hymenobacter polaris TaxID=2682546 RepID=A0A7Y0AGH4_9BACT|nr:hypothetical protein [Hymenobacter polaris]NML66926.1 hypothetical protein [Hymenobacter polaris]
MSDQPTFLALQELTFRPDLDVLLGRWRYQPALPAELRASYQQLADLALTHRCRFWLQDLRRRLSPDEETKRWLLQEYYPSVARRFGQRLFVAYLFSPDMHRQIVEAPDYAPPEAYQDKTYALNFFGNEGEAVQWLQAHQPTPPPKA